MKHRLLAGFTKGVAAVTAALFALSSVGTTLASSYRTRLIRHWGTKAL